MFKNRLENLPDGDDGKRPLNGPEARPQNGSGSGSVPPTGGAAEAAPKAATSQAPRRKVSLRAVVWGLVLGAVVGLPGTMLVLALLHSGDLPQMKPADFRAAQRRWSEHGPADYDLDIEAGMGLKGRIHVEVRGRAAETMTFDGKPSQPRLWDYWTVPGLLEIIQADLERNEAAAQHPGGPEPAPLFLQAEFDPEYGLPTFYRRTELASRESGQWRVIGFHPR
jgi:hypothetical protein